MGDVPCLTPASRRMPPGSRRSKVNQYENKSLIKIEHVNSKADTDFYLGKRCAGRLEPEGSDLSSLGS